jgi:hypothetical protein
VRFARPAAGPILRHGTAVMPAVARRGFGSPPGADGLGRAVTCTRMSAARSAGVGRAVSVYKTRMATCASCVELPSRESVSSVVTAGHPAVASLHADVVAREALAELAADRMPTAAGARDGQEVMSSGFGFRLPSVGASTMVQIHRPAVLSDVARLPHRLREAGLWGSSRMSSPKISAVLGSIREQNAACERPSSHTAVASSWPRRACLAPR